MGHGAHGADACRALLVEAEFRHRGQPGTILAPALSTDREQQQQHILTQRLLQHSVLHTTAASVGQQGTHRHAHARTHIQTNSRVRIETCTGAHMHMHTHKRTGTNTHTHIHVDAYMCAHKRAHMHTCNARTRCAQNGFAKCSASLATLPHMCYPLCLCKHGSICQFFRNFSDSMRQSFRFFR